MFDFGEKNTANTLNVGETSSQPDQLEQSHESLIIYQDSECFRLLSEVMQRQGFPVPKGIQSNTSRVPLILKTNRQPLIFIEASNSAVGLTDAIRRLVSHQSRVVIIGREDCITVYRRIRGMGFYYLLLPADTTEINYLLNILKNDQRYTRGPMHSRAAMRIAVVSMKGGTGCTLVSTELSFALQRETGQPVIVTDHNYNLSNMHIMLGKKDLARSPLSSESLKQQRLTNTIDPVGVQSRLVPVVDQISYMGVESRNLNPEHIREYTHLMLDTQSREANFIVEDFSGSINFYPDPAWLCPIADCVVLMVQPTLSGLHETRQYLQHVKEADNEDPSTRILLVLNHTTPEKTIDRKLIEQYLDCPITAELPYVKSCEGLLTSGKRLIDGRSGLATELNRLSHIVLGRNPDTTGSFVTRLTDRLKQTLSKSGKQKDQNQQAMSELDFLDSNKDTLTDPQPGTPKETKKVTIIRKKIRTIHVPEETTGMSS